MKLTYHATNASCLFAGWLQRSAALPLVWRVASPALVTGHGNLFRNKGNKNVFVIVVCHSWPNKFMVCITIFFCSS